MNTWHIRKYNLTLRVVALAAAAALSFSSLCFGDEKKYSAPQAPVIPAAPLQQKLNAVNDVNGAAWIEFRVAQDAFAVFASKSPRVLSLVLKALDVPAAGRNINGLKVVGKIDDFRGLEEEFAGKELKYSPIIKEGRLAGIRFKDPQGKEWIFEKTVSAEKTELVRLLKNAGIATLDEKAELFSSKIGSLKQFFVIEIDENNRIKNFSALPLVAQANAVQEASRQPGEKEIVEDVFNLVKAKYGYNDAVLPKSVLNVYAAQLKAGLREAEAANQMKADIEFEKNIFEKAIKPSEKELKLLEETEKTLDLSLVKIWREKLKSKVLFVPRDELDKIGVGGITLRFYDKIAIPTGGGDAIDRVLFPVIVVHESIHASGEGLELDILEEGLTQLRTLSYLVKNARYKAKEAPVDSESAKYFGQEFSSFYSTEAGKLQAYLDWKTGSAAYTPETAFVQLLAAALGKDGVEALKKAHKSGDISAIKERLGGNAYELLRWIDSWFQKNDPRRYELGKLVLENRSQAGSLRLARWLSINWAFRELPPDSVRRYLGEFFQHGVDEFRNFTTDTVITAGQFTDSRIWEMQQYSTNGNRDAFFVLTGVLTTLAWLYPEQFRDLPGRIETAFKPDQERDQIVFNIKVALTKGEWYMPSKTDLLKVNPAAKDRIIKILKELSDPASLQAAVEALSELEIGVSVTKDLVNIARDAKLGLPNRRAAILVLDNRREETAVRDLIELLKDPSPEIRTAASCALANIGAIESRDALRNSANDAEPTVRFNAVIGLRVLEDVESIYLIEGLMLNDPNENVRAVAVETLEFMNAKQSIESIEHALVSDRSEAVKAEAAQALSKLANTRHLNLLADQLAHLRALANESGDNDGMAAARTAYIEAIRAADGNRGTMILIETLIGDPNTTMKAVATAKLGYLRASEAVDALMAALDSPDPVLRANAVWALGQINDKQAFKKLSVLCSQDDDLNVRNMAANAMVKMDEKAAVPYLIERLRHMNSLELQVQSLLVRARWLESRAQSLEDLVEPRALQNRARSLREESNAVAAVVFGPLIRIGEKTIIPLEDAKKELRALCVKEVISEIIDRIKK